MIQERIIKIIEAEGINRSNFSKKISIMPQTLHNIVSGRRTNPSYDIINSILKAYPNISARWLITGEGSMYELSLDENGIKKLQDENQKLKADLSKLKDKLIELLIK
jgi:transcriptional regulator with XRE-family HTH domain